jgi:hypothetical protein
MEVVMKLNAKWASLSLLCLAFCTFSPTPLQAQCGGTERWAVKVGTDPKAGTIDLTNRTPISLQDLINLPEPQRPPRNDNRTRLDEETHVYVIQARLVQFKFETNDNDFHLVITDDTLNFSPGGPRTTPSGHSFVAEIPDPNCIGGAQSTSAQSVFIDGIRNARGELQAQFQNINTSGKFNDASGIPVQIVGIGFFDRPHNQTGRAPNNIEIHPILDIIFNPPQGNLTLTASPTTLTVPQGGTASTTISTVAASGLNSDIALSTSTPPTGAMVTFSPTSIAAPGSGSSTLSITVGSATPLGNSTLTVSGSGGGTLQNTNISLTVIRSTTPPVPTASVSVPPDGTSVTGLVNVAATGSDAVGVVKLEIYIDGALKACNFGATSISYPWDTTAVPNGTHTVLSKAYNAAGGVGTSSTSTVTVTN